MKRTEKNDLVERTSSFAASVRLFAKKFPQCSIAYSDVKQLVRSSGSVAANYIEAQDASSRRDFAHKNRISLREAKESCLWLHLLESTTPHGLQVERISLAKEANELAAIFTTLVKSATSAM